MNDNGMNVLDQNEVEAGTTTYPPGSNLACNNNDESRVRREWDHLSNYDRELYLDAIETAIERGMHHRFAKFHHDKISQIQAHDTCGFYLWHRIFTLAYEDMLRSLEPRFACISVPFWDVWRDYSKQLSTTNVCRSYATCSKIINDIGGIVQNDDFNELQFFGDKVDGLWHFKSPIQNLRDDRNNVGLIRYDMWFDPIPNEVDILNTTNIVGLFSSNSRVEFWEKLQHGIHNAVHDTIGGFMRTNASPIDPIFMPWHSTMDLYDYIWEACYYDKDNDKIEIPTNGNGNENESNKCTYTSEAQSYFPNISVLDKYNEVYMKLNNKTDIRDDPLIGKYFSDTKFTIFLNSQNLNQHQRFRYTNIPQNFIEVLANNTRLCPNGLGSVLQDYDEKENAGTVREPPTFSSLQVETFKNDWIEQAQVYYNSAAANDTSFATTNQQQISDNRNNTIKFLRCLLDVMDVDTLERWGIDSDTFLIQVVKNRRYNKHPSCRDFLSGGDQGAATTSVVDQSNIISNAMNSNSTTVSSSSSSDFLQGAQQSSFWLAFLLIQFTMKLIIS